MLKSLERQAAHAAAARFSFYPSGFSVTSSSSSCAGSSSFVSELSSIHSSTSLSTRARV